MIPLPVARVVAVGGTLIYVGTRGHSRGHVERLPHLPTTTSSVLLPEGTCTFGIVELHRDGDKVALENVTVDATGKFRLDLPVGDYHLVGTSS